MRQVSADFFSTVAQVIPTLALVVFLTDLRSEKEKRRMRRRERREWEEHPVRTARRVGMDVAVLVSLSGAELLCLIAVANGGGSQFLAFMSEFAVLLLLWFFVGIVTSLLMENAPKRAQYWTGACLALAAVAALLWLMLVNLAAALPKR